MKITKKMLISAKKLGQGEIGSIHFPEITAQLHSQSSPPLPGRKTSAGSQASPTIKAHHVKLEIDMKSEITIILAPFKVEIKDHKPFDHGCP